jgi:hypothetical protein
MMSDNNGAAKQSHSPLRKSGGKPEGAPADKVLQVERRDYVDLAPTDRPRAQSMRGSDLHRHCRLHCALHASHLG